jgi:hypothetical protein
MKPKTDETCGAFIRRLIMMDKVTGDEIAALARKNFKGSTATKADVSWNRGKLRRDGTKNVPDAKRDEKATAKPKAKAKAKPKRATKRKKAKAGKPPATPTQEAN